jgi:hypothetical protein
MAQLPGNPASNLRGKYISTKGAVLQLDSLSIIPGSVRINGVPDSFYHIDAVKALLFWKTKPSPDSVQVRYRVFPFRLNPLVKRYSFDSVMNNFVIQPGLFENKGNSTDNIFNFGNLTYTGSFGRAISFGNNQDAVVNSNFQLQLNGFLGDSIEIAAAITDNNIPIQPDGNTQQLNEFDRISLQFKKNNWQLNLGDIDIRQNSNYFLNFYKRLQGISFQTENKITPNATNKVLFSGSIAKGKFNRNILRVEEGNQGPYRLTGANNELFFVVLPNTERVFIDGELLQRGEDQDYVINYNTAEISFTPRRLITKDSRVQAEFEYADRNFLNTNLYLSDEYTVGSKLKISLGMFANTDAKNSQINQKLDDRQVRFLDSLGDNVGAALYPNAVRDSFETGKVLYANFDTLVNGTTYNIYQYNTNKDSARFSLSFVDLGQGNGNYIALLNGVNGKAFNWVAPVNGIKQGRFEPVVLLVTPKKQQLISIAANYTVDKNTSVRTELAMSNYDINTFSRKDKNNDRGYAAKLHVQNTRRVGYSKGRPLQLQTDIDYEFVEIKFRPLERLRNVEFARDWGLDSSALKEDEHIGSAGFKLSNGGNHSVRYQVSRYWRGSAFTGYRHAVYHDADWKGWRINNIFNLSSANSIDNKGAFLRPTIGVNKQLKKMRNMIVGFNYALEHSLFRKKKNDSVTGQSFSFDIYQAYLRSAETQMNKWSINYFTRSDKYPVGKNLVRADRSQNVTLTTELMKNPHHQFRFNMTYRNLQIIKAGVTGQKADQSLLGRAEYFINEWKGLVTGNILYELGSGQEQRRDFTYLEVPAGQGQYYWIDYNGDGITQLNEFELGQFRDQLKYIRIFTPTNEFIKANYTQFNYSFSVNPRAAINMAKAGRIGKFLTHLNLITSLQIGKKEIAKSISQFNPFAANINDTSLITLTSIITNTLSYNRFSTKWGFDIGNVRSNNKSLLTYGYEGNTLNDWTLRSRWNINRTFSLDGSGKRGQNILSTPSFDNRNYNIITYTAEPRFSYTKGSVFRISASYKFEDKTNILPGPGLEAAKKTLSNSLIAETRYNVLQNTSVNAKFTFNQISFTGKEPNSTVGFIMLDGLQPGKNYLWNIDYTRRLANNLELNFRYEGRKPGDNKTIHTGNASVRALF